MAIESLGVHAITGDGSLEMTPGTTQSEETYVRTRQTTRALTQRLPVALMTPRLHTCAINV